MKRIGAFLAVSGLILGNVALARAQGAAAKKVECRWGAPQKMDPIPGCGVPRQIHVAPLPGVERLMFARDDNPTLTRYFYRGRAIGAQPRVFKRMVNVSRTDLVLCPGDFQKARILAFRVVRGRIIAARAQCELGKPGPAMKAPVMSAMAEGVMAAMAMISPMAAPVQGQTPVTAAIERQHPVSQQDLVKLRRARKMDSLARLLGFLGLLLGLGATVGVLVLALFVRRRLRALEIAPQRAPDLGEKDEAPVPLQKPQSVPESSLADALEKSLDKPRDET